MKLIKTPMMTAYLIKLAIRISIFITVLVTYLFQKDFLVTLMTYKFALGFHDFGFTLLHLLWVIFMTMMIRHLIPIERITMAIKKSRPQNFDEVENYSELELYKYVQNANIGAWWVLLVWAFFNGVIGFSYLMHFLDEADLLMCTTFFFLCDYICILIYCPFQDLIMKNKCCVNCRIYEWGHFMMFTPMLFIKNFFSWSLFFTSLVVLIHWELVYAKNPERFYEGSNAKLQCRNCKDKTCQIKKKVTRQLHS